MEKAMVAAERLYLTADKKKLVSEGDPKAAILYATPGDEIPASSAKQFGLVDGGLPEGKAKKGGKSGSTKEDKGGKDKEDKGGDDKGGGQPSADLSSISGVGPATVKLLAANGIASIADLAAADPAQIQQIDGLSPSSDPTAWVEAAKLSTAPAEGAGA